MDQRYVTHALLVPIRIKEDRPLALLVLLVLPLMPFNNRNAPLVIQDDLPMRQDPVRAVSVVLVPIKIKRNPLNVFFARKDYLMLSKDKPLVDLVRPEDILPLMDRSNVSLVSQDPLRDPTVSRHASTVVLVNFLLRLVHLNVFSVHRVVHPIRHRQFFVIYAPLDVMVLLPDYHHAFNAMLVNIIHRLD